MIVKASSQAMRLSPALSARAGEARRSLRDAVAWSCSPAAA